jgi:hypothetical protein
MRLQVGFDWNALLAKTPRGAVHVYAETCRCPLHEDQREQWAIRERFAIPMLPRSFTAHHVLDEAEQAKVVSPRAHFLGRSDYLGAAV